MRVLALIAFACVGVLLVNGATQSREAALQKADAKSQLARFVGRWEGPGHMMVPGFAEPQTSHAVESVQWKLGNTAVLVEGRGTVKDPKTGEERVVHDALGIMRIDPKTGAIRFIAMKPNQPMIDTELQILDNGDLRWETQPAPGVTARFTTTLTQDTWTEIGEITTDGGTTWKQFMDMKLKRIAAE